MSYRQSIATKFYRNYPPFGNSYLLDFSKQSSFFFWLKEKQKTGGANLPMLRNRVNYYTLVEQIVEVVAAEVGDITILLEHQALTLLFRMLMIKTQEG